MSYSESLYSSIKVDQLTLKELKWNEGSSKGIFYEGRKLSFETPPMKTQGGLKRLQFNDDPEQFVIDLVFDLKNAAHVEFLELVRRIEKQIGSVTTEDQCYPWRSCIKASETGGPTTFRVKVKKNRSQHDRFYARIKTVQGAVTWKSGDGTPIDNAPQIKVELDLNMYWKVGGSRGICFSLVSVTPCL